MIQRLQSLYLLAVVIINSQLLYFPLGEGAKEQTVFVLKLFYAVTESHQINYYPLGLGLLLSVVLSFLAIFLYKNRMLQYRVTVFNTVLMFGIAISYFVYLYMLFDPVSVDLILFAPFLATFFSFRAARLILRDELLVKSLNRVR